VKRYEDIDAAAGSVFTVTASSHASRDDEGR
jgi:hypothetical protein